MYHIGLLTSLAKEKGWDSVRDATLGGTTHVHSTENELPKKVGLRVEGLVSGGQKYYMVCFHVGGVSQPPVLSCSDERADHVTFGC